MLPSPEQETHFLQTLKDTLSAQPDDYLQSLIQRSLDMKRPKLAGKIFALLPPSNNPNPAFARAQQALRLMLLNIPDKPDEQYWENISTQWNSICSSGAFRRLRSRHKPVNTFGSRSWRRR